MTIDVPTFLAIVVPCTGVLVWLVRLEGRINMHDRLFTELNDDVKEIKGDVKALLRVRHANDLTNGGV